jgi:trehalose 6-phosphate phosphatase
MRSPERTAVLCDFDGTLSAIVLHPDDARPVDGAVDALAAIVDRYGLAGVISGRPVAFLERRLPPGLVLCGLNGLECLRDGERNDHPSAGTWREVIDDVAAICEAKGPTGMWVERKGLSLTLHYRQAPEAVDEVRRVAEQQAMRSGLLLRPAKMSYELHPPVAANKGTTLYELVHDAGLRAACFLGDDVGDLTAFDALDRLAADGVDTVRVGVRSPEAPALLLERADLVVDGPEGALAVLEALLP